MSDLELKDFVSVIKHSHVTIVTADVGFNTFDVPVIDAVLKQKEYNLFDFIEVCPGSAALAMPWSTPALPWECPRP